MPVVLIAAAIIVASVGSCSSLMKWPDSPVYEFPATDPAWEQPEDPDAAMRAIEGHYAHYDVIAYEDVTTRRPMKTFIISYGFTDFRIEDGTLLQIDRFCHAEQKLNQKNVTSVFSDEATQAIRPRTQEVELEFEDGAWRVFRPASPTLLGITGDPSLPLTTDTNDPNITDPDGDGNPGVTVKLRIGSFINGEIYLIRREIFQYYLTLNSDGNLYGYAEDKSEQLVLGASLRVLRQPSNQVQLSDPDMSPVILVRVGDELDTCEELMHNRDLLFPEEPAFR